MKLCSQFLDGVVALAAGGGSPTAELHVATCASCMETLTQYKSLLEAARRPYAEVPDELSMIVKSFMQPEKVYMRARLVGSTLGMAGVRSLAMDKFQLVFEAETVQARLLYVMEGKHWEVVGRVNDGEWQVSRPAGRVRTLGDGRFEFTAPALSDTGLVLRRGDTQVDVPSAEEAGFGQCG